MATTKTRSRMIPLDVHTVLAETLVDLRLCNVSNEVIILSELTKALADRLNCRFSRLYCRAERQCWVNMNQRCYRPYHVQFHNYGGRGIEVCPDWQRGWWVFYRDMGPRPLGDGSRKNEYSIDRINPDGHYEPSNCRWTTRKEQQRNMSIHAHKRLAKILF